MTRRAFSRIKRRVNCELTVEGARYMGVVLDLSPKGFFIQTNAAASIGSQVSVDLRRGPREVVRLTAVVANRRDAPRRLASVTRGGLGCRLSTPPEDYYRLLASISGS